MNAADIVEQYGRGVPAIVQSTKLVDVCEYLLSCSAPGTVILSEYGEVKGTLSQKDIINASGRLGSSVMQMVASDLVRDLVPACEMTTHIIQVMELLNNTSSEFVLVTQDGEIKGMITLADVHDLLLQALTEEDETKPEKAKKAAAKSAPSKPAQPAKKASSDAAAVTPQPEYEEVRNSA
ncbi:CBS domain-containing protein [Anderseniella sp. Alg231-50]|uniref:CBS domain-containing protein n=1 Tax=Anderseniella sp. Alg231-50 TaxID=1922226 RepID=UPI000D554760